MSNTVISVEKLSKYYRLGLIGGGTLREDLQRGWASLRGRPDPLLKIGQEDHGNRKGDQIWALKDVNFEVKEGEILGIIGRNGAGKSTLLKILSRITAPTEGKVTIRGRVGSLLEVGTGFHPELTGRENIYLNGTILGMTKSEVSAKLEEIVEFAEIAKFIDTPVKRYSSGMTVRLAFAVAAHLEPEILIVDEVLAVGDAAFQKKCLGKMKDAATHGRTILFVSHQMRSVQSLCTRAMVLSGGKIELEGQVEIVVSHYLSAGQNLTFSREWPEPDREGDSIARLVSVFANNCNGEATGQFDVQDEIYIEFKYQILGEHQYQLSPNIRVFDTGGSPIFVSIEVPDGSSAYNKIVGQEYVSVCKIPKNLMNEGTYSVTVAVSTAEIRKPHFLVENALIIEIVDNMKSGGTRHPAHSEAFPGVIRPLLEWETFPGSH